MQGAAIRLAMVIAALVIASVPLDSRVSPHSVLAGAEEPVPGVVAVPSMALAPTTLPTATAAAAVPAVAPVPPPSAPSPRPRDIPPPETTSASVLLLDDASGAVLFERNGHQSLPPASLTKLATAIIAIEQGDLDAQVEVDVDSRTMRGSSVMGLEPGDRFSLRDLLYGLMLPSGNDAALAVGRHVAETDAAFVERMNALLLRLGLSESHFMNPHGLGGTGHYASAYDLAMLSRYAMTLPVYREVAGADRWVARGSREITLYSLVTEERWSIPGVDAGKSGYTRTAGRTLVLSAERAGQRLHVVVMNDPQTERTAAAVLEWGFTNFDWAEVRAGAAREAAAEPSQ